MSLRSIVSMSYKLKCMQPIFRFRMIETINWGKYLINVDLASYSRSVKTAYSGSPEVEAIILLFSDF